MTEITAQLVKKLRTQTGAGMMDCKKALVASNGNVDKAIKWLCQKDLIRIRTLGNQSVAEGLIESYIHTHGRIGVLVEVNCQTDFVARSQEFRELTRNIAMQIAAFPVEYIGLKDIPAEVVEYERAIESAKDDLNEKPAEIREKAIAGRLEKRLQEITLLDQPYISDQTMTVNELIGRSIAVLGENIQVRRFARFSLSEGWDSSPSADANGTPWLQPLPSDQVPTTLL